MIHPATNPLIASVTTLEQGFGPAPNGVAVTPDGRFAYVANSGIEKDGNVFSNTVSVIDVGTNTVIGPPITVGSSPFGVAATPDGKFVYVTNFFGNSVSVINTTTNAVVGSSIPVGASPAGVAITPDGKFAYVTNNGDNTVSVISTATNTVVGSPIPIPIPNSELSGFVPGPEGVAITPNGQFAYVTNTGDVHSPAAQTVPVINTATNAVVPGPVIQVGKVPLGVAITPDGKFAYVANEFDDTVSVIDTATKQPVTTITLVPPSPTPPTLFPFGVAITPNGQFVYVTNSGNFTGTTGTPGTTVSVISTQSKEVFTTITVGTSPFTLGSFIGPNIIVANGGPLLVGNDAELTTLGFGNPGFGFQTFVDFSGGTLQTTGSLLTSRTISLLALGGTIDTNGFNSVFSGDIINSGSLTKIGSGTLTLSGNNSYSGGTNIFGGVLEVGSDTNLGTGNLHLANHAELLTTGASFSSAKTISLASGGGTLASANGTTATYAGIISGTGPLSIGDGINRGMVLLNAPNTYTGGTTINGGILAIAADTNLGAVSGALVFDDGTLQTLASFSTARTTTLQVPGGTFDPVAGTTLTEAGTITGLGGLTKTGAGTVILEGGNTYSGGTVINAGSLVVNSAPALGLGNVVVNGGVLRANAQPIKVIGNYTQNSGGTLQLSLGGSAAGQYDFLNVGGHATLDGTLHLIFLNTFQPKIGDKLTVVLAAGGVSGQFANALNPVSSLIGLELLYQPNSVILEFPSNFAAFARTPNELAVARQLDGVAFDPRESQLIFFLQNEPLDNLPADFEKISPDSLSAIYDISFSAADVQAGNLENRFAEIRNGSTGFTSSLNIPNSPGAVVEGKDGKTVIEPSKNVLTPSPENKWGVWINGSGDFVNVDGDGNGKGYDFVTGGVSFGLDYRLTENIAVGVAVGYAHTSTNLTGNGSLDVNSGRGGLYATYSQGGLYLNGYAGGAYNSYEARRDALGGSASGNTSGGEFDGYAGAGYEFQRGGFTFGPIASLEYAYVELNEYHEQGSLAPLRIISQNQDSLRTNLGLKASYHWKTGKLQLRPSLRASWQHEFSYSALPIEAQFDSGAGSIFTVHGPSVGHDSALINTGVDVQWTPTFGTYFGYIGQAGRKNYESNAVVCSVHVDF